MLTGLGVYCLPLKDTLDPPSDVVVLLLWMLFVIYVSCLSLVCCHVCSLQPCYHLLGKGSSLGSLACCVFLCFCHFPIWCSRSGVVLDCIDSRYLFSSLL